MRLLTILARCGRLRCVRCGRGPLFAGWFRMHYDCPACGLVYDKAPGYYLGSIYYNYGVTVLIVTAAALGSFVAYQEITPQVLAGLTVFSVLFPLWFFRYARALWLGMDELLDLNRGTSATETPLQRQPRP